MSDTPPRTADPAALLAAQRRAFCATGAPGLAARRADLDRLATLLRARRDDMVEAVASDFGTRPAQETLLFELAPALRAIAHMRRNLGRWMRPERRRVDPLFWPARARVLRQPLGTIGIVSPWNYPLALALVPLATALAAGNRAMLKPSEVTPATAGLLSEMLAAAFPPEQVACTLGGPEVGAAFAALPFDHLFFTGSTEVGRKVMNAAAANLTPVTLELGGKSPAIVQPGLDPARAAADIAFGKLANAGQTCIAPDYALVHRGDLDRFVEAIGTAIRARWPGGAGDARLTSIVNARHRDRLRALIADARTHGARIVEPAPTGTARPDAVAPTLILDVTDEMRVMREEIFGPLLPVVPYDTPEDAIAYVNARPRPLALYWFGDDAGQRDAVLARTTSGNVTINDTMTHYMQDDLPFGGVGDSGIGAYHGREGFCAMTHARGVLHQPARHLSARIRPPGGRLTDLVTRWMMR